MSFAQRPPDEFTEGASNLTVRDRMNHAFLLANGVLTFQKTTTTQESSEALVRETVMALFDLIPDVWEDQEFKDDIARGRTEQVQDVRPNFCGETASIQWCQSHGVPAYQKIVVYNHHLLMKACINLLERRGFLSRKVFKEIFTGKRFKKPETQDMVTVLDEIMKETTGGY